MTSMIRYERRYTKEEIVMSEKFVLNETSIFGRGCRTELINEINSRGFKKVLLVTDK